MANWPYNTTAWKRLREVKLQASPLCEPCERRGKLVRANTVDHIKSIASGGDPFPSLDGLMSMCHACHNTKTNAVDRKGGKGIAFKGVGADGMPIDPTHPCYIDEGYTPSRDQGLRDVDRRGSVPRTKFRGRR